MTQDWVVLRSMAQSPVAKQRFQADKVSDMLLGKKSVNERMLFCHPYFASDTQIAWQLRHYWFT